MEREEQLCVKHSWLPLTKILRLFNSGLATSLITILMRFIDKGGMGSVVRRKNWQNRQGKKLGSNPFVSQFKVTGGKR